MVSVASFQPTSDFSETSNLTDSIHNADTFSFQSNVVPIFLPDWLTGTALTVEQSLPSTPKNTIIENWSVITMMFLLSLFASIRFFSGKYIRELFQTFYKKGTIARLFREKVNNITHVSHQLDLLFLLTLGLFAYHFSISGLFIVIENQFVLFLVITLSLLMFLTIKNLLYRLSGILFDSNSETQEFVFYTKTGNRLLGLFLLPVVVSLFFTGTFFSKILIISGVLVIGIISIINAFRGVAIIAKKVFPIYYMILYLCTLEILPLLLVWRILRENLE